MQHHQWVHAVVVRGDQMAWERKVKILYAFFSVGHLTINERIDRVFSESCHVSCWSKLEENWGWVHVGKWGQDPAHTAVTKI